MTQYQGSFRRKSGGFTLVELLVVIAIIGLLIALLLPAVQMAREAARKVMCSNHLKQLGLALHNYHGTHQSFPMSYVASVNPGNGRFNIQAWGTMILPYIEQGPLYDRYNFAYPPVSGVNATSDANMALISTPLPIFNCASSPDTNKTYQGGLPAGALPGLPALSWSAAVSDYCVATGVRGVFADIAYLGDAGGARHGALQPNIDVTGYGVIEGMTSRMADIVDGSAYTILLGERTGGREIYSGRTAWNAPISLKQQLVGVNGTGWGDALNGEHWLSGTLYDGLPLPPQEGPCGINCTNLRGYGFYSFHPSGANFLFGDGSVRLLVREIDQFTLAKSITRQKRETVRGL